LRASFLLPGKCLSAVLRRAANGLPAEAVAQIEAFHTQVVDYLRSTSAKGAGAALMEDAAVTQAQLLASLPSIKKLAGKE
ncbi:hypothetical protein HaLaN_29693, partial [Haematococcus lacustris]